ncbi:hypothetical protein ACEPAG_8407 [Sanghuangporus baumii]
MFSGLQRLWSRGDRKKDEKDMLTRTAEADKQKYGFGYTAAPRTRIGDSQRRRAPVPAAGPSAPPRPDPAATTPAVPVIPVHVSGNRYVSDYNKFAMVECSRDSTSSSTVVSSRRDIATITSKLSPIQYHSTTKSTYMEHPQESRRAQSALIDQQRETIRHLRNLDEWMSRSVREREDDLQRLASNIEDLGNELRDELGRRGFTTTGLFS